MAQIKNTQELLSLTEKLQADKKAANKKVVAVCCGTACQANGALKVQEAFDSELVKQGLADKFDIKPTGCHGFCERGTLVLMHPEKQLYTKVKAEDVAEIVEKTLKNGEIIESHLYDEPGTGKLLATEDTIPFYSNQVRTVLADNGHLNPKSIEDYISNGGFTGLSKSLEMGRDKVIETIKAANLRGRGGGGFPAGIKWEVCKNAAGDQKYVICNADEGDPGAFMDRSIIEGNPQAVIEGLTIAAYAVGANKGFVYVRNEYPLAIEHLIIALDQAREKGLLGDNILGTEFSFDIHINRGGGAFVCGEETALIASVEGRVGEPVRKPPYPAIEGLFGKPTIINNVETLANVALILKNGADWFTSKGTKGSPGTKIFSLVGKVNNTGLVEVETGMTLRDVIFKVGGGILNGRKFKAVQTGGPSGGCLPESKLDVPVDFDTLLAEGSMMGSGGMIVMDDKNCMVDVAKYFLEFLKFESCGKCTTCREGLSKLHMLVTEISEGKGDETTIDLIEELAETVETGSLCALGKTGVNPIKSTLKYFRDEYEAHIKEKRCPAGVCKELITFEITDACTGCMVCKKRCPQSCITGDKKQLHVIDQSNCIKCGVCQDVCKFDAVKVY
ncbi:MAG: NADH-quinone oxidoreductase subunit NuoF [Deltaproteobacteria bacterium]|nr:NADH-quinone oxidoreductase subunit NuoF [Deltaproteobacteria bacterium]